MNIPVNNYNPQPEIDEIVNTLCKKLENGGSYASCNCFGKSLTHIVIPALEKFKEKGWFTYYHKRFDGVILDVQIYKDHYTPRNSGFNHLIEY